jgi:hypothetical protein
MVGEASRLDTKAAYHHSRTAGHLYQAVLRAQLTARLGVGWGPVTHGTAEVVGNSRRLRRVFSKRSDAIAHQLYRAGLEGPRAAQAACLASRDPKTHIDADELQRRWRAEATAAKVDPDTVVAEALGRASPPVEDEQALTERLLGPSGLTEQRTWFGYDDLLQAVCTHLPAGAPADALTVERLAARVLAHPDTIPLDDSDGQPRWTTRDLLEVEQQALATADRLHHSPAAPVDPLLVEYALRVHGLAGEQADLVRALTLHPGRLSVVVGPAGAGKTAALAAARTAWGHDDQLVLGCATAALAAQQLGQAAGITSTTVAAILRGLQDPRPSGWLPPGGVLVVDEAGMVGTRDLATLLAAAEQQHSRLVLVGDPAQLPEIDAGGLFGHLARHPDAALADNRRQQTDWERDALAALRAGRTGPALGAYLQHGHVHIDPTPADRTDRIVEDYLLARQVLTGPDDVLVLTATRAHAAHLNTAIRDTLRATGHLGTDQLHVDTVDGPRGYSSGDQVLVTRNDPSRGLLNGDRATVTTLHPDHGALTIQLRDGRDLTLPGPYLADGRLDHAYALTVHKAQGQTSQLTLVAAAPSMTRETAYTALSRGRLGNYLYLTPDPDTPTPADAVGAWIADTALAETAHAIHRTSAHQLATDLRSVAVPPMGAERSSLAGMAHPEAPSSPRGLSI